MIFIKLYPFIYSPLLWLLTFFKFFNPKIKKGFKLRKPGANKVLPWLDWEAESRPLWFHCASGEFEYAKPVIRRMKQKYPQTKIMVTYFSPSVVKSLEASQDVDFFCPMPWDQKKHWRKFIDHHKPQALLVARTDLWPLMLTEAKRQKVPRLLFSKTAKTHRGFFKKFMEKRLLPLFNDVFCASLTDQENLKTLLPHFNSIHNSGDTRYDQCLYRLQHGRPLKTLKNFSKKVFIAGSTWPSDEYILLPTIKERIHDVSFIIAPHEPNQKHLSKLTELLEAKKIGYQFYSQIQSWNPAEVLIIDEVGILADLYAWGNYAFVGGSMDRSVHSVMEPLAQGLLCFVGPEHENNREAMIFREEKIGDMTPVQVVADSDLMLRRFEALYHSWSPQHQMDLKMKVREKAGASDIVVKWIENNVMLGSQTPS